MKTSLGLLTLGALLLASATACTYHAHDDDPVAVKRSESSSYHSESHSADTAMPDADSSYSKSETRKSTTVTIED